MRVRPRRPPSGAAALQRLQHEITDPVQKPLVFQGDLRVEGLRGGDEQVFMRIAGRMDKALSVAHKIHPKC